MSQRVPIPLHELPDGVRQALGRIRTVTYPSQGATSAVAVVTTASDRLVVKRARGPQFPDWLEREHAVLRDLQPLGLPVPRPVYYERPRPDEAWLVMEHLPGEPIGAVLARETDRTRRDALLAEWGAALRRLHDAGPPPGWPTADDWLDRALAEAARNAARFPQEGATPELLARLHRERPAPGAHGLIHGDCTVDNTLVLSGRVTGFIDWSGGAWGDRRYDLTLATRPEPGAFAEQREKDLAAFYAGYGGTPLPQREWEWFEALYEFF
ncbi:MAG: aminoglycoside phosphotransferase family protein [Symbiobacterium sp.]|uniref:phosphotransferase family protein n=1 Tax=Symbiobacterium sp. TaxID=1971213 RepID=UPI003464B84A